MKYLCIKTTYSKMTPEVLLWTKGKHYEKYLEIDEDIRVNSEHHLKKPLLRVYSESFLTPSPIGLHIYHTFKYLFT